MVKWQENIVNGKKAVNLKEKLRRVWREEREWKCCSYSLKIFKKEKNGDRAKA